MKYKWERVTTTERRHKIYKDVLSGRFAIVHASYGTCRPDKTSGGVYWLGGPKATARVYLSMTGEISVRVRVQPAKRSATVGVCAISEDPSVLPLLRDLGYKIYIDKDLKKLVQAIDSIGIVYAVRTGAWATSRARKR